MLRPSTKKSERFSWLTPLNPNNSTQGPWTLADNETYRFFDSPPTECRKIAIGDLLMLITGVLKSPENSRTKATNRQWMSACGRYRVSWIHQQSCTTRLFIQNSSDYFTRVELRVEDELLIAFHEPVWPHLQPNRTVFSEYVIVPANCLDTLESHQIDCSTFKEAEDNLLKVNHAA